MESLWGPRDDLPGSGATGKPKSLSTFPTLWDKCRGHAQQAGEGSRYGRYTAGQIWNMDSGVGVGVQLEARPLGECGSNR